MSSILHGFPALVSKRKHRRRRRARKLTPCRGRGPEQGKARRTPGSGGRFAWSGRLDSNQRPLPPQGFPKSFHHNPQTSVNGFTRAFRRPGIFSLRPSMFASSRELCTPEAHLFWWLTIGELSAVVRGSVRFIPRSIANRTVLVIPPADSLL